MQTNLGNCADVSTDTETLETRVLQRIGLLRGSVLDFEVSNKAEEWVLGPYTKS